MKEQDPKIRIHNFDEVPLGYAEEEAVKEASRCLNCKNAPCMKGCPAEVDIPAFIKAIKEKRFADSIAVIKRTNNLPAVCGRVCPQEDQCEKVCVLNKAGDPINIGSLERYAADWEMANKPIVCGSRVTSHGSRKKIAVIGSGPAGLTCAADLAKMGCDVTVFEALHVAGGVLVYGIPEFRLPKEIVKREVDEIGKLGVEIKLDYVAGVTSSINDLRAKGFKAFFVGSGAGLPHFLGIEGEDLNGVYSANEFLTRVNLMKAYRFPEYDTPINVGEKVGVVGGGNVAVDAARCALRLGAKKVYIIYRRTEKEMPARLDEVHHAQEEGIEFRMLTTPVAILGDEKGEVRKMRCLRNELGEPDASGRRSPIPVKGSEFDMELDTVVVAIGNGPNPLLLERIKGLKRDKRGNVEADENGRTSVVDVFAGGDIVTGSATVIAAMGAGKSAARSIAAYLGDCLPAEA